MEPWIAGFSSDLLLEHKGPMFDSEIHDKYYLHERTDM